MDDTVLADEARRRALAASLIRHLTSRLPQGVIPAAAGCQDLVSLAESSSAGISALEGSHRVVFRPPYPGATEGAVEIESGCRLLLASLAVASSGAQIGVVLTTLITGRPPLVSVAPPGTPIPVTWQPLL